MRASNRSRSSSVKMIAGAIGTGMTDILVERREIDGAIRQLHIIAPIYPGQLDLCSELRNGHLVRDGSFSKTFQ